MPFAMPNKQHRINKGGSQDGVNIIIGKNLAVKIVSPIFNSQFQWHNVREFLIQLLLYTAAAATKAEMLQ